jgi:hypothetical protein
MCTNFSWKKPKGRDNFGDLGVDGRIILKISLQEMGCEAVDWIHLV